MTGAQLIAVGHAAIAKAHELILLGGVVGLASILAGLVSRRVGAPVLLVFLVLGMLAGDDHVFGIAFDNFTSAYLIGSVALAIILFEGGLKTPLSMLRFAFWPAAVLATIGVAVTAVVLGVFVALVDGVDREGRAGEDATECLRDVSGVLSEIRGLEDAQSGLLRHGWSDVSLICPDRPGIPRVDLRNIGDGVPERRVPRATAARTLVHGTGRSVRRPESRGARLAIMETPFQR